MKRTLMVAVALLALVVFAAPSVTIAAPGRCSIKGTNRGDFLPGSSHHDVICARGGNDYASGQEARDKLRGGPGNDTLVGGKGNDKLRGRGGSDKLFGIDGSGGDVFRGGPGNDQCYGEKHDRFRSCEKKVTNHSPLYPLAAVTAMEKAYARAIQKANRQLCLLGSVLCIPLT